MKTRIFFLLLYSKYIVLFLQIFNERKSGIGETVGLNQKNVEVWGYDSKNISYGVGDFNF